MYVCHTQSTPTKLPYLYYLYFTRTHCGLQAYLRHGNTWEPPSTFTFFFCHITFFLNIFNLSGLYIHFKEAGHQSILRVELLNPVPFGQAALTL